mmetsp:Transcript_86215/g.152636  ORF Transcript_86215/g.152636 Transcript_86215/m.152636 type:complete len:120 (+) Transcript_86215:113-472(+)
MVRHLMPNRQPRSTCGEKRKTARRTAFLEAELQRLVQLCVFDALQPGVQAELVYCIFAMGVDILQLKCPCLQLPWQRADPSWNWKGAKASTKLIREVAAVVTKELVLSSKPSLAHLMHC